MNEPLNDIRQAATFWRPFQSFFRLEAASGILLIVASIVALVLANSPLRQVYFTVRDIPLGISIGEFTLTKGLVLWINDALMAVFFFFVGLEIKRELRGGELSRLRNAALPFAGALGGIVVPATIYVSLNLGGPGGSGWAVPLATDIAFALGVLALLGSRAPVGLKVFLTALAIIDDLAAVLVIALFYTAQLDVAALTWSAGMLGIMVVLNRAGVRAPVPYLLVGLVLWYATLKSGMHATVAGVLAAFTIPHRINGHGPPNGDESTTNGGRDSTLLERLEHDLQPWVAFGILPIFALANAGVTFPSAPGEALTNPIGAGVFFGLVFGKPLGITAAVWLALRVGLADRPAAVTWRHLHGAAWLCGIGFTMSLFIANLAFDSETALDTAKLGVLSASLIAGIAGWTILRSASQRSSKEPGYLPPTETRLS